MARRPEVKGTPEDQERPKDKPVSPFFNHETGHWERGEPPFAFKNNISTHEYDGQEERHFIRAIKVDDWEESQKKRKEFKHTLLDNWWQHIDDELAKRKELGRELRGYVERPEKPGKSDRDKYNRQFYWRSTFGAFKELPDGEDGEGSKFSLSVLGKMALLHNGSIPTYEVVLYDFELNIWVDAKDMSTPYGQIKFWSYIPEVVSIEFRENN